VYHVNISLTDSKTRAAITDAEVEASVADPVAGETKKLELMVIGDTISYGNYFRMPGDPPYAINVRVRRPDTSRTIETRFELRTR
jgi:hypothetical protein